MDEGDDLMKHVTEFERTDYKGNKHINYRYEKGKVIAQSDSVSKLLEMVRDYKPPTEGTF